MGEMTQKRRYAMKKKKLSIGLVGCGSVAVMHCNAICDAGQNFAALCDIIPEKAKAMAEKFAPDAKLYTDYAEMLSDTSLDVIHICTPHYLHADMAIAALEAGKHVFLEKPLCTKAEDVVRIEEAEKKAGKKICVCFQNRFLPSFARMQELVAECGGALHARASVTWKRSAPYYTDSPWRGTWEKECGGVMINQAIHNFDLLLSFFGEPDGVQATVANHHLGGVIEVEDTCTARLTYSDGRTALFLATTSYGEDGPNIMEIKCPEHRVMLYGDKLFLDGAPVEDIPEEEVTSLGKKCWGNGHIYIIRLFYESILEDKAVPVSVTSASVAVKTLLRCYEAANAKEVLPKTKK